jgi:hypothetical protein
MRNRSHVRIVVCAVCAGAVCGGAGCKKEEGPVQPDQPTTSPVTIALAQEGKFTFVDSSGAETVLTIGKGKCEGTAQGKTTFRQASCTFPAGTASIKGEKVTVNLESASGSATRDGDRMTLSQNAVLRLTKSGAGGYECTSTPIDLRGSARVNTKGAEELVLAPSQEKVTFVSSQSCNDASRALLDSALARAKDYRQFIDVACW